MKKISVVIPTYNRRELLERAVESVFKQSYSNWELIVVDDGSSDNTVEFIEGIKDSRVRFLKTKNEGVSAARNKGIDLCSGDWVAFLDSDDEWLPEKLHFQVDLIEQYPDLRWVHGEEKWIRHGKFVNQKKIHQKSGGRIFSKCLHLCLISPSAVMIHRELLNEERFDEEFIVCEDYDLWLRLTSKYPIGFVETPIIKKYGGHEDQLSARYKGMDYWRIRAMDRISNSKYLSEDEKTELCEVCLKKASILKEGCIKHGSLQYIDFLDQIIEKYGQGRVN